jgi:hypothetical protein
VDGDKTAFSLVVDQLETLRRNRETEKVESKKQFEIQEQRLLAERDRVQRELERARQLEAQRGVKGHIAAMRAQAAGEIPADPADRRSVYHKKIIVQIEAAVSAVKDTQAGLTAFARTTLPSLTQIAALGENDIPISWQPHHRARLIGLAETAAKIVSEHRGYTEQAARVVRQAELLLAQTSIDGDDADVRTKVNTVLRDLGYAAQGVMLHLTTRADNVVSGFAQVRKDGDEFKNSAISPSSWTRSPTRAGTPSAGGVTATSSRTPSRGQGRLNRSGSTPRSRPSSNGR